jgi:hypothetical protein
MAVCHTELANSTRESDQLSGVSRRQHHRFFNQDMSTTSESLPGELEMGIVRRRDHDPVWIEGE